MCNAGYTTAGNCSACPAGKYKVQARSNEGCVQCDGGFFSAAVASPVNTCRHCDAGSYSSADNSQCILCQAGSHSLHGSDDSYMGCHVTHVCDMTHTCDMNHMCDMT